MNSLDVICSIDSFLINMILQKEIKENYIMFDEYDDQATDSRLISTKYCY